MITMKAVDVQGINVGSINYKGQPKEVKDVVVRWLSKEGQDSEGSPAYGLRLFTVGPGGVIPIHSHLYMQTMYILTGEFDCFSNDPETDEQTESKICGPGDAVYIPAMEPHGMKNLSSTESGSFLCCICTLEDKGV